MKCRVATSAWYLPFEGDVGDDANALLLTVLEALPALNGDEFGEGGVGGGEAT